MLILSFKTITSDNSKFDHSILAHLNVLLCGSEKKTKMGFVVRKSTVRPWGFSITKVQNHYSQFDELPNDCDCWGLVTT